MTTNNKKNTVKYGRQTFVPDPHHLDENMFKKGYKDFFGASITQLDGTIIKVDKATNPFSPNSIKAKEWQRGFDVAYFANLRRMEQRVDYRTKKA
jgi:hypothetical protein